MVVSAAILLSETVKQAEEPTVSPYVYGAATFAVFLLLLLATTRFNPDR